MPSISIVIPTYNFGIFLPDTLDSIVNEGYPSIEILVFDGGSTDNTPEILEQYRTKWPALKILSATERGNIDIDLNKAVAHATGDYIWTVSPTMSSIRGWSGVLINKLNQTQPDLLLTPAVHCDIRMQPRRSYPILKDESGGSLEALIESDDDLLAYLDLVRTSEGLFSFCSACLVRRDRLLDAPALEQANGTCWRYSARLISILTTYPSKIIVLANPLIYKRGDNDSFAQAGLIRRLQIATLNWDKAIGALARNPRVTRAMATLARSDIRPTTLLFLSQFPRDREEKALYDACVRVRLRDHSPLLSIVLTNMPRLSLLRGGLQIAKALVRVIQRLLWGAELRARALRLAATSQAELAPPAES